MWIGLIVYFAMGILVAYGEHKRLGMIRRGDGNTVLGWIGCTLFWPIIAGCWLAND